MRARNIKNKKEIMDNCNYLIKDPLKYKGEFNNLFNNNNPIHIEIGMGKGKFINEMAIQNPNINFIGIEKQSTIITKAIQNYKQLPNLKLINMDAVNIDEIFVKEIDLIYLNFSDPWPKNRHNKRRLTDETFLKKYDSIFKGQNQIKLKTDNDKLFEYSIASLSNYGYTIKEVSLDLNSSEISNISTEYEEKFIKKGIKIKFLNVIK